MTDTVEVRNEADLVSLNQRLGGFQVVFAPDTIGKAIDALNSAIALVNAASQRVKAFGVNPQISVNGPDYGDTVSLYLQGEPSEVELGGTK